MVDTFLILMEIQRRYGLTDLKLVHYKSLQTHEYEGEVRYVLMPRTILSDGGILGPELLKAENVLLIYEQASLGTLIAVLKRREGQPEETVI